MPKNERGCLAEKIPIFTLAFRTKTHTQTTMKLVVPNGEEYVRTDGEKVIVAQGKDGRISVGDNASEYLKRMSSKINNSGSKTAAKQFMKLANNECRIHFHEININR